MNNGNSSKRQRGLIHPLTEDELNRLETALDNNNPTIGIAARLMGRLGLRVAEVSKLIWRNVNLNDWHTPELTITAETTKTGYARTLPLPQNLYELLRRHRDAEKNLWETRPRAECDPTEIRPFLDTHVITKRNGSAVTIRWYQLVITAAGRRTLNRRIHPHTLRHTFATRLLQETNIRVVQVALGHRSIRSTQIYTHPTMQDLREALQKTESENK